MNINITDYHKQILKSIWIFALIIVWLYWLVAVALDRPTFEEQRQENIKKALTIKARDEKLIKFYQERVESANICINNNKQARFLYDCPLFDNK